ncbi:beta-ketoacyl synthase N-terminal-like domain-containing protein [Desulfotalea psychrophila]|uniref:Beta-ketoacyl synthase-like N-terminal domain-containing protein n=1 Tax=Desulfotalea psychrophila (strain LSv54 / DSM 12343) TaxID=177439 RepID=Q6AM42_DESPS|nr:beta-ketoacyl synthase N-terminal-like domain-containing protein [Desulfotalea psychrophila]CAG36583.1 unknown protein [Desulfotalea psychrophila LSv54]
MIPLEIKKGLLAAQADEQVKGLLGSIPPRWGRMSPLSRLLIVELAQLLQEQDLLMPGERLDGKGLNVGLIGASRRGSLFTDRAFVDSMDENSTLASPALFGYTLANIPLAEAALTFGLTGPVYALFADGQPLPTAKKEAQLLLQMQAGIDMMFACEFDHYLDGSEEHFLVEMKLLAA